MPENPTYRITGDDWDPPEQDKLEASPASPTVPDAVPPAAPTPPAGGMPWATTTGGVDAAHPAGWAAPGTAPGGATPAPAPGGATPAAAPGGTKVVAAPGGAKLVAATSGGPKLVAATPARTQPAPGARQGALAVVLERLPAPIGPTLERVPPRLLLGGGGIAIAAVVAIVLFASSRPASVAATPTPEPTELVPVATASCETPTLPLAIPDLVVTTAGEESRQLAGFPPPVEVGLDGPWPAELGAVEASVVLGSTLQLTSETACIAEWRAIAAHPPASTGKPWRPDGPDSVTLGWQHADRVAWQPSVPLPPRGEWIIRLTVWYRDSSGATAPTPAPLGSDSSSSPPLSPDGWVVERYYRIVVEARDS